MQQVISQGKNSHLHIFVNTELHNEISKRSKEQGITMSEYARIRLGDLYDLNEKAFSVLAKCKKNKQGTITYNQIFMKLCTHFSIDKEECKSLLRRFEKEGKIKYVKQKGVRITFS
jgi:hypothetical protein